jgi:hypothetical protein
MDYKKVFDKFEEENVFIKTTTGPGPVLDGALKAALNRKGNILYNQGDVEGARRIFMTTGYSDGLSRIGDYYKARGRPLDALKMYWTAPDRGKAEPIIVQLSDIIRNIMRKEDSPHE